MSVKLTVSQSSISKGTSFLLYIPETEGITFITNRQVASSLETEQGRYLEKIESAEIDKVFPGSKISGKAPMLYSKVEGISKISPEVYS